MLETQIARAPRMKIHFHGPEKSDSQTQVEIFQRLAKHCSRWEELDLTLTSALLPLFASLRGRLPLLRRVWIQWAEERSQTTLTSMDVFDGAPSLVDVGIYSQYRFLPFSLPVQQLTHYDLDAPWRTHQAILKTSPKLVEARIVVRFDHEPWPPEEGIIELPCLRRLYASCPEVLHHIRVPALEDLMLRRLSSPTDARNVLSSITRSACALQRLCLACLHDSTVITLLTGIPSIIELRICVCQFAVSNANTLLKNLVVSGDITASAVAPQLCSISVGCEIGADIDCDLYKKMAISRRRADHCALTRTALVQAQHTRPDRLYFLDKELREEGLNHVWLVGVHAEPILQQWDFQPDWTF
ncbi:hypothetical protein DFH06DRAFT_1329910 [Mycena polygramma]|nr:hypothetical protein DFH06DRAFT_1329910 [Mycena polygramma]